MALLRTARLAGGIADPPGTGRADGRPVSPDHLLTPEMRDGFGVLAYTCPAGKRAVVRHVSGSIIAADLGLGANFQCYIMADAVNGFFVAIMWFTEGRNHRDWTGHCVMNPGETLHMYVNPAPSSFYFQASGAEMDLPTARVRPSIDRSSGRPTEER